MLLGLFVRIFTAVLAFIGFLVAIVWVFLDLTGHGSMFDSLPVIVGAFLLLCVLCYGTWDIILTWRNPEKGPSDEKQPKI